MALRDEVYKRAEHKCECTMKTCKHHKSKKRCLRMLRGEWQVHRITAGGPYTLSNVIAMCKPCHHNTPSYGVGKR